MDKKLFNNTYSTVVELLDAILDIDVAVFTKRLYTLDPNAKFDQGIFIKIVKFFHDDAPMENVRSAIRRLYPNFNDMEVKILFGSHYALCSMFGLVWSNVLSVEGVVKVQVLNSKAIKIQDLKESKDCSAQLSFSDSTIKLDIDIEAIPPNKIVEKKETVLVVAKKPHNDEDIGMMFKKISPVVIDSSVCSHRINDGSAFIKRKFSSIDTCPLKYPSISVSTVNTRDFSILIDKGEVLFQKFELSGGLNKMDEFKMESSGHGPLYMFFDGTAGTLSNNGRHGKIVKVHSLFMKYCYHRTDSGYRFKDSFASRSKDYVTHFKYDIGKNYHYEGDIKMDLDYVAIDNVNRSLFFDRDKFYGRERLSIREFLFLVGEDHDKYLISNVGFESFQEMLRFNRENYVKFKIKEFGGLVRQEISRSLLDTKFMELLINRFNLDRILIRNSSNYEVLKRFQILFLVFEYYDRLCMLDQMDSWNDYDFKRIICSYYDFDIDAAVELCCSLKFETLCRVAVFDYDFSLDSEDICLRNNLMLLDALIIVLVFSG